MRKYRFSFNFCGLLAFLLIMLPNFIWFAVPAPNDILCGESVTPVADSVGSVCQVLLVAALCMVVNREREKLRLTVLLAASAVCGMLYYVGWILYYLGLTDPPVILLLTLTPCLALLFYAADRRNFIALVPGVIFTGCHLIYGIVNFII